MSTAYYAGVVCGALTVVVILIICSRYRKAKGVKDAEYDERQKALRGRGYKFAYETLVIYLAAYILLDAQDIYWCEPGAGLLLGILFSAVVFVIYCIYKDAYFRVSDRPKFYVALFGALGVGNIGFGFLMPLIKDLEGKNSLGIEDLNFIVGVFTLIVFVNVLIKLHLDKKAEME